MPKLKATVEVVYDFVPEAYFEEQAIETIQEARLIDDEFLNLYGGTIEDLIDWCEREGVTYEIIARVETCQS